ncbi:MAG: hypothetical protein R3253_08510 [Longimicrobiales bacterium]|nr:hypothetical protein [Longimicrobiales bacterium]
MKRMRGGTGWAKAATVFLAAVALGLSTPGIAVAQPGGADREARLTRLFSQMSVDTGLRLSTSRLYLEGASFRSLESEAVRVEYGGEVVPVELGDIRSVEVAGRHPVKGMLWGLGAGLLVGSVSGMLVGSYYCTDPFECRNDERRGAYIGGASLGAAGAIGGFLIGKYQISWRPIFP